MKIIPIIKKTIQKALQSCYHLSIALEDIHIIPTRKSFKGTHTFVTFGFTQSIQEKPNIIADKIGNFCQQHASIIKDYTVIKGFLNFTIHDYVWLQRLVDIHHDMHWGKTSDKKIKIVIEFSSPNTNKPLHLGHLRNIFLGDALSKILQAAGYQVYTTNLVNDRGIHICKSMIAYQLFGKNETPESTQMKGDHLVGKYYVMFEKIYQEQVAALKSTAGNLALQQVPIILLQAKKMLQDWEKGIPDVRALWKKMNTWVYAGFEDTYQKLNISFDRTYYESQTYLLGKNIVEEGLDQGFFFQKKDKSIWVDLTNEGLDEKLLLRTDGTAVYITQDMGTADLRYQDYQADQFIYVVGSEQNYHFKVLFSLCKKLHKPYAAGMQHLSYGMVDLPNGKMKSREGTVVDADQLIEEMVQIATRQTKSLGKVDTLSPKEAKALYHMLAISALKYFLLKVDPTKKILFDPQSSIDFQGHTGPFIQYTYARIAAILRKINIDDTVGSYNTAIDHTLSQEECTIIIQLDQFPEKIQESAHLRNPAILAQYIFDLAKNYNRLYANLSILKEKDAIKKNIRLLISITAGRTIQYAMQLLNIDVPETM